MDDKENLLLTDIDEGIPAKDQIEEKREDKVDIYFTWYNKLRRI